MALAVNSPHDFILFSHRPESAFDGSLTGAENTFSTFPFDMDSQYTQGHAELAAAQAYDVFPIKEGQRSGDFYFDALNPMGSLEATTEFPVSMASTSPSVSQSLDQASNTFSLPSGTSTQSAASSTIGSPYSQHTPNLSAGQDQFYDPSTGLGIAPALGGGDDGANAYNEAFIPYLSDGDTQTVADTSRSTTIGVGEWPQPLPSSPSSSLLRSSSSSSHHSPALSYRTGSSFRSPTSSRHPSVGTSVEHRERQGAMSTKTARWPNDTNGAPIDSRIASPRTPSSDAEIQQQQLQSQYASSFQAAPSVSRKRPAEVELNLQCKRHQPSPEPITHLPSPSSPSPIVHPYDSFFNQSSGRFVPPLQLSCWFPYCL